MLWNPPLLVRNMQRVDAGQSETVKVAADGPSGKLKAVEEKRAKQEATRGAVRSRNNSKSGSSPCIMPVELRGTCDYTPEGIDAQAVRQAPRSMHCSTRPFGMSLVHLMSPDIWHR